ncbi:MAG: hypothetical protein KIS62_01255 [Ramlibacter sp.]|nr:hypothetical protein [Ramlibacter sp.]
MAELTTAQVAAMRQRAEKAREFAHTVGITSYTLRRPPALRFREMVLTNIGDQPGLERRIVVACVVGWQGPVVSDVDPEPESAEVGQLALPCTPEMVELYLQDRMDDYASISNALMDSINRAREERDAAKKASAG